MWTIHLPAMAVTARATASTHRAILKVVPLAFSLQHRGARAGRGLMSCVCVCVCGIGHAAQPVTRWHTSTAHLASQPLSLHFSQSHTHTHCVTSSEIAGLADDGYQTTGFTPAAKEAGRWLARRVMRLIRPHTHAKGRAPQMSSNSFCRP